MPFTDLLERREAQRKNHQLEVLAAVEDCIRTLAGAFPCRRIWLFGSLVGGRFHRQSDVDIAVEGLPDELLLKAHAFLMRCVPAGHDIDLKPFESLAPSLRQRVEREGRILAR